MVEGFSEEFLQSALPADAGASCVPRSRAALGEPLPSSGDAPATRPVSSIAPVWSVSAANPREWTRAPTGGDAANKADGAAIPTAGAPEPESLPAEYRMLRLIGQGGMGEIWEAEQRSLGRLVAVKRARADRRGEEESRGELEREFQQEARVAARLEHPNIVPVHDLGRDGWGSTLVAMKLVRGKSWHRAIEEDFNAMPPADFLAKHLPTLIDAAQAVAFAHSKGIIHRDIKPGQVMTGEFGEVMLMDWGLAVYVGSAEESGRLAPPKGLPTLEETLNPAGTPVLMAPEQAVPDTRQLGPWTDVYLLGGTLYFLLTGTFPHRASSSVEALKRARVGLVEEPERRASGREVPPELSALAMKALEREPGKRVPSAKAFVEALNDYLSGASKRRESRAIADEAAAALSATPETGAGVYQACAELLSRLSRAGAAWPGNPALAPLVDRVLERQARAALANGDLTLARSQAERIGDAEVAKSILEGVAAAETRLKAQRRNLRLAIASAIALLLAMLAGGAWFTRRVIQESAAKEAALAKAETANEELGTQLKRGQDLISYIQLDLGDKLAKLGRLDLMRDPALKVREYYRSLPADRMTREGKYRYVDALLQAGEAVSGSRDGTLDDAMGFYRDALALAERLVRDTPNVGYAQLYYSRALMRISQTDLLRGRLAEARDLVRAALAASSLALERVDDKGEFGEADMLAARSHRTAALMQAAEVEDALGNSAEAQAFREEMIELLEEMLVAAPERRKREIEVELGKRLTLTLQRDLEADDMAAAKKRMDRAMPLFAPYASPDAELGDEDTEAIFSFALLLDQAGVFEVNRRDYDGAIAKHKAALALFERLCLHDPNNDTWASARSTALCNIGLALSRVDIEGAIPWFEQAAAALSEMLERDPSNLNWVENEAVVSLHLASCASSLGRKEEAIRRYDEAVEKHAAMSKLSPDNLEYYFFYAYVLIERAKAQGDADQWQPQIDSLAKAEAILRDLMDRDESNVPFKSQLATSISLRALALEHLGRWEEASQTYRAQLEIWDDIRALRPANLVATMAIADTLLTIHRVERRLGRWEASLELVREAVEHATLAHERHEEVVAAGATKTREARFARARLEALRVYGALLGQLGKLDEALEAFEALLVVAQGNRAKQVEHEGSWQAAMGLYGAAYETARAGRYEDAERWLREGKVYVEDLRGLADAMGDDHTHKRAWRAKVRNLDARGLLVEGMAARGRGDEALAMADWREADRILREEGWSGAGPASDSEDAWNDQALLSILLGDNERRDRTVARLERDGMTRRDVAELLAAEGAEPVQAGE